jgi:hypothetical protein
MQCTLRWKTNNIQISWQAISNDDLVKSIKAMISFGNDKCLLMIERRISMTRLAKGNITQRQSMI